MPAKNDRKALTRSLLISLGTGIASAMFSGMTVRTYEAITKPPLSPPAYVFGIVWTILYILMGIASYQIYSSPETPLRKTALYLYIVQLAFNFFWPILFFSFEAYWLSFLWLIVLWVLILLTTVAFYRIRPSAGLLMVPYLLWVAFAGYLNYMIALLN